MTPPAPQPISEAEFTRKHILTLWACKRLTVEQIARMAGVSEAEVYNIIGERNHAERTNH